MRKRSAWMLRLGVAMLVLGLVAPLAGPGALANDVGTPQASDEVDEAGTGDGLDPTEPVVPTSIPVDPTDTPPEPTDAPPSPTELPQEPTEITVEPTSVPSELPTSPTEEPQASQRFGIQNVVELTGSITKVASNDTPVPGEIVAFTITASGTAPAGTVLHVNDVYESRPITLLDSSIQTLSNATTDGGLSITDGSPYDRLSLYFAVAADGMYTVSYVVRIQIAGSTGDGTPIVALADLGESNPQAERLDSTSMSLRVTFGTTPVTGTVTITASNENPVPGEVVTFTIELSGTAPAGTGFGLEGYFSPASGLGPGPDPYYGDVEAANIRVGYQIVEPAMDHVNYALAASFSVLADGHYSAKWQVRFMHSVAPGSTISGTAILSQQAQLSSDTVVLTVAEPPVPMLSLDTTVSPEEVSAPGPVTWTFAISNDGNVDLSDLVLASESHDLAGLDCDTVKGGSQPMPSNLDVDHDVTCVLTTNISQEDIDAGGTITTTAQVTSNQVNSSKASATVTIVQRPEASLAVTAGVDTYEAVGDEIPWTFTATNGGNVTLTNLSVAGDLDGLGPMDCDPTDGIQQVPSTLSPGDILSCTAVLSVTQAHLNDGSVTNHGTFHALQTGDRTDSATAIAIQLPELDVQKTVTSATTELDTGDLVTYEIVVSNTGNVPVDGVVVTDPGADDLTCDGDIDLDPETTLNCTASYTITEADLIVGTYTNNATAEGSFTPTAPINPAIQSFQAPEPQPITVAATGSATVTTVALDLSLEIEKSARPGGQVKSGDTVSYTFVVTNTGNATLHEVTVNDPLPGLTWNDDPVIGTLGRGESTTLTATVIVSDEDVARGKVVNTAEASGLDPRCPSDEPALESDDPARAKPSEGIDCVVRATSSTVTIQVQQPQSPATPESADGPITRLPETGAPGEGPDGILRWLLGGLAVACAAVATAIWRRGVSLR